MRLDEFSDRRRRYGWQKDCAGNGCAKPCTSGVIIKDGATLKRGRDSQGHLRFRVSWMETVTYGAVEPCDARQLELGVTA